MRNIIRNLIKEEIEKELLNEIAAQALAVGVAMGVISWAFGALYKHSVLSSIRSDDIYSRENVPKLYALAQSIEDDIRYYQDMFKTVYDFANKNNDTGLIGECEKVSKQTLGVCLDSGIDISTLDVVGGTTDIGASFLRKLSKVAETSKKISDITKEGIKEVVAASSSATVASSGKKNLSRGLAIISIFFICFDIYNAEKARNNLRKMNFNEINDGIRGLINIYEQIKSGKLK